MRFFTALITALFLLSGCGSAPAKSTKRESGKVKFYSSEKDFGFVIPDKGGDDLIFIKEGIKNLKEDQRVEFDRAKDDKGVKAVNLKVIGK